MEATLQGLYVTVVGMSVLFLALGILMACMYLLSRAFPVREAAVAPVAGEASAPTEPPAGAAHIAAMAVALALAERPAQAAHSLTRTDESQPGPWVVLGRQDLMAARRRPQGAHRSASPVVP